MKRVDLQQDLTQNQAAGGIISASILSTPGASKLFKGGLTVYTLESRIAFGESLIAWNSSLLSHFSSIIMPISRL